MLSQLNIQNFGLIDSLTVDFEENLNVFTGATGAGKSILIDALRISLGDRLRSSQIRDRSSQCVIEAVFELTPRQIKLIPVLTDFVTDEETAVIITRTLTTEGRNKNKINGFSVTVSQLKDIGDNLVDLHGPHDHQMLFSESSHIRILDRLSDLGKDLDAYKKEFTYYSSLLAKLEELKGLSESSQREMEILRHQIRELEQVSLEEEDHQELVRERNRINNAEKLYEHTSQLLELLENDSAGISSLISRAFGPLQALNETDESTTRMSELLETAQTSTDELSSALNSYLEKVSFEPGLASEINERYDQYYEILRKYGPTLNDAAIFLAKAKEKYDLLIDLEHNDAEITNRIKASVTVLNKLAKKLNTKRGQTAELLGRTIEKELKELGISNVSFECRIERADLSRTGYDRVTFYISPNAGEDLKPLADIVSSGEAARVMLALKKALTKVDPIPVLIFDEIDAQIGGRLGKITGKKLKELSADRQVILITHLPQIASFADHHLKVIKTVKEGKTFTKVIVLDHDAKVAELAEMMSGEDKSDIAVEHARDMYSKAKK